MDFMNTIDGAMIVSDKEGTIIYLNEKAISNYAKDGGRALIGKKLAECHKPSSNDKIRIITETLEKNVYTIEKKGKKKIIYQTPWYQNGEFAGIVELSLEIPVEMPHFVRE
jgi:transcriptional regulator with PAS, ATPase and Fis domain